MAINWELGRVPNFLETVTNGFQAGRAMAKQDATDRAYRLAATDPGAASKALIAAGDPQAGMALDSYGESLKDRTARDATATALAGGDTAAATQAAVPLGPDAVLGIQQHVAALSQAQREVAQKNLQILGGIYHSLRTIPGNTPEGIAQRLSVAQHMATNSPGVIKPEQITADDVSDEGLTRHESEGLTYLQQIELHKPVMMAPGAVPVDPITGRVAGGQPDVAATGGAAPASAPAAATPAPTGGIYDQVAKVATWQGAAPEEVSYLQRLAQVESGGRPDATNGSSTGIFQFHPATFAAAGGGNIHDPIDQTKAALTLARQDRSALTGGGVEPTDANLYIMHQQGAGGGLALLKAPLDVGAVAALTPAYRNPATALAAIAGNIGMRYRTAEERAAANAKAEQMTAGDFVNFWHQRWGNAPQQAAAQPAAAPAASPAAPTNQPGSIYQPQHIHAATPAEIKAAGLPDGTAAQVDAAGKVTPYPQDFQPERANNGLSGEDFLKTLPIGRQAVIRALVEGRATPQQVSSFRGGERQRLIEDAGQYQPGFDLGVYSERSKTRNDYAGGKQGTTGGNIASIGTSINHLNGMDTHITDLKNIGWRAGNRLGNWVTTETGNPSLSAFMADRKAVSAELVRAFRGAGGSLEDVRSWEAAFDNASSPAQLESVIKETVRLLESRLGPLASQYNKTMGTDRTPESFLDPKAAAQFGRLRGDSNETIARSTFYSRWQNRYPDKPGVDQAWDAYRQTKFGNGAASGSGAPTRFNYDAQGNLVRQ